MSDQAKPRSSRCPTCKKTVLWVSPGRADGHEASDGAGGETVELPVDSPHRPFCSPRCKLIDLGRWLDEEYRISRPLGPDDENSTH
ncbi:MAG: DNA gyrase inhibitor YacG [Enhygromyxa sp.]